MTMLLVPVVYAPAQQQDCHPERTQRCTSLAPAYLQQSGFDCGDFLARACCHKDTQGYISHGSNVSYIAE